MRVGREEVLRLTREMVELSVFLARVEFRPSAHPLRRGFPGRVLATRIAAGATTINVPDTVGYALPQEYAALMDGLYEKCPSRRRGAGAHCHKHLGVPVPTPGAVERGATQVEGRQRIGRAVPAMPRSKKWPWPSDTPGYPPAAGQFVTTEIATNQPDGIELHGTSFRQKAIRQQERLRQESGIPRTGAEGAHDYESCMPAT